MINTVTTIWKENMQFESDNPSGNKMIVEATDDHGGNNEGFSPKALMLSSLAGCTGLDVVSLFKKMRVVVDDFKIIVTANLTDEHPKHYNEVTVDYHFYGSDFDEKKIHKAVYLSVDRYCGVMEMFRQFSELKTAIHYHEK